MALLDVAAHPRVAVVSGSYGAGHDAAAEQIALRLIEAGCRVTRHDVVGLFPWRIGRLLRWSYFQQLRRAPDTWGSTLDALGRGAGHTWAQRVTWLATRRLLAEVGGADVVVSTHPFASQALGRARVRGRLDAPVVTYLTDASVHALWVAPGVDLHLALHEVAAHQARSLGGEATVVAPLVPDSTAWAPTPSRELGIGPVALVVGGSEGVGELEATARDVLATGVMTPVVVCGRNEALRSRLDGVPGLVALGWRDDLPALIRASTCVLQNAGGFTSLEALALGTPVLTYRALPGHGRSNAANLELAGLVPWVRCDVGLGVALRRACRDDDGRSRRSRLPVGAPTFLEALTLARSTAAA